MTVIGDPDDVVTTTAATELVVEVVVEVELVELVDELRLVLDDVEEVDVRAEVEVASGTLVVPAKPSTL